MDIVYNAEFDVLNPPVLRHNAWLNLRTAYSDFTLGASVQLLLNGREQVQNLCHEVCVGTRRIR